MGYTFFKKKKKFKFKIIAYLVDFSPDCSWKKLLLKSTIIAIIVLNEFSVIALIKKKKKINDYASSACVAHLKIFLKS